MILTERCNKRALNHNAMIQVMEGQGEYSRDKSANDESKHSKVSKRISLEKLMDLKVDYAFKQLFGSEKNKEMTVIFLNAILQKTGRNLVRDISFENTELGGEYRDDKQSRLDLLVVTDADEWINIEIQFTNKYDMMKRSLYYWSKAYAHPLGKGMAYSELRPVIAINILNFSLFNETERFHSSYHLYDDESQAKLTNVMEFHFIEISKLMKDWKRDKLDPWNSVLARWLLLLGMVDHRNGKIYRDVYKELEVISMKDESLRKTFKNWEELSTTQEQRLIYDSRLKQIMDEEAFKRRMELQKQAIEQGEQKLEQGEQELEQGRQELERGKQELEQRKQELDQGKGELEQGKQELERGEQELEQGKQELDQGKQELEREKQELEQRKQAIAQEKQKVEQRKKEQQTATETEQKSKRTEQRFKEAEQKEKRAEQSTKVAIARNLLQNGMEMALVAESTGLTMAEVTDIQREAHE
ncbi:hypothetical protein GCM10007063_15900 [Lentibacillus kapialis]|uniref:Rpn family recombination-promoting nuclease/putative transposase n=1 Tax=Lentibacillus kapialis TaxID=340214 RepID=A0A917PV84_9BACI|nr:Rpn family recombination-promoting nuclease/putative transposase [Lentibacillus kapialis]GGJ94211.1 hypothetical protein GCM10007063_15900 [Lentibacillus kapialis]